MKWVLNLIYAALLLALSPLILWRVLRHGRYRRGWSERLLGRLPRFDRHQSVVWFHAVSVGEVLQLQRVVQDLRAIVAADTEFLITTSTDTGFDLAKSRFNDCSVSWFPLDFSWSVDAAIRRVKPSMVVLVELELWPNFLSQCSKECVPVALINARMSDRSFRGYSLLRSIGRRHFQAFATVAAQTQQDADRLIALGARDDAVHITGSVKFDGVITNRDNEQTNRLRSLFNIARDEIVFIAGSTQQPEEQLAIDAWKSLRGEFPQLRLILVPRHRERFGEVAKLVTASGCTFARRTRLNDDDQVSRDSVIVLDTIGELGACWGLADIAFVGGSFGSRGGQNMLEPAAYGAAVMFGPNTRNFRDIVRQLLNANAAIQLEEQSQLQTSVAELLRSPEQRRDLGNAAKSTVLRQQGAIAKTVLELGGCVGKGCGSPDCDNYQADCSSKDRMKTAA